MGLIDTEGDSITIVTGRIVAGMWGCKHGTRAIAKHVHKQIHKQDAESGEQRRGAEKGRRES